MDDKSVTRPPLTRYELLANNVSEALVALMADVPKLEKGERRSAAFIRTHIGISFPFVMSTAGAVEHIPDLERMEQMNAAAAWDANHLLNAFRGVITQLIIVTGELQTLLDTRQANAACEALRVYALAQALLRRRFDPGLASYVKKAKRELGRGRPRKKKKAGATDAAVATAKKKPRRHQRPRPLGARLKRRVKGKEK